MKAPTSLIILALVTLTACSVRKIKIGNAVYTSTRFGMKESFGEIRLTQGTNTFTVKAMESDQVTFAKEVVSAAIEAGVKGVKP